MGIGLLRRRAWAWYGVLVLLGLVSALNAWEFLTAGPETTTTTSASGATTFIPSPRASLQRSVSRPQDPATFWLAIVLYSAIGLGIGGLATWLIREAGRPVEGR